MSEWLSIITLRRHEVLRPYMFCIIRRQDKASRKSEVFINRPMRFLGHDVVLFGKNVSVQPDTCIINVPWIGCNYTASHPKCSKLHGHCRVHQKSQISGITDFYILSFLAHSQCFLPSSESYHQHKRLNCILQDYHSQKKPTTAIKINNLTYYV
jgi:hypothetical protein